MARFSVTASMIQSQSLIFGKVVVEVAGGDELCGFGSEEGAGTAFQRGVEAVARRLIRVFGWEGRYRAAATESGRWRGGRRCGSPWSRLRERRHGVLVSFGFVISVHWGV